MKKKSSWQCCVVFCICIMYSPLIAIYGNFSPIISFQSDRSFKHKTCIRETDPLTFLVSRRLISRFSAWRSASFLATVDSQKQKTITSQWQSAYQHIKLFTNYSANVSYRFQARIKYEPGGWLTKTILLSSGIVKHSRARVANHGAKSS